MSANVASYGCVSLPGINKVSKMKPDSNGYYRQILGGFNMCNQSGIYYPLTDMVRALFNKGGVVRRRLDAGLCRGEYDHPKLDGMKHEEILRRLAIIEPTMVSHHIKSVELVEKKVDGKDIVLVYGMVKPTGPYAEALRGSFDNPEENIAFSIRSFCKMTWYQGKMAKIVTDALTWDHVCEPGIKLANQFDTVSLESMAVNLATLGKEILFTESDFDKAIQTCHAIGMENDSTSIKMIKDAQGWHRVRVDKISSINW